MENIPALHNVMCDLYLGQGGEGRGGRKRTQVCSELHCTALLSSRNIDPELKYKWLAYLIVIGIVNLLTTDNLAYLVVIGIVNLLTTCGDLS